MIILYSNFNPRSRGGSDVVEGKGSRVDFGISIHAPAEGATLRSAFYQLKNSISIHAPAEGATKRLETLATAISISIHAPAEGATQNFPV